MKLSRRTFLVILISSLLFLIPFSWLKAGEMDLGGDSSRLYFYDPFYYLINGGLYGISASAFGLETIYYFNIPFLFLLIILKSIFSSPTLIIEVIHGFSISSSFIFCYLTIRELIDSEKQVSRSTISWYAAVLGALFYALSPATIDGWEHVLLTHNQIFLNPLIFYLLLKYFKTSNINYIFIVVLLTFLFAPSFSIIASPALFAFYPLSILFLILYTVFIIKKRIIVKQLFLGLFLFLVAHAFHLIPQVNTILTPGSSINATIFSDSGKFDRGLNFFAAIAPSIRASINLLGFPQTRALSYLSALFIVVPFTIILSLVISRKRSVLFTTLFFLVCIFFATANITNTWLLIYKAFFKIPGFSMFRNFYGQWQFVYIFFLSILFGQALYIVLGKFKRIYRYSFALFMITILIVNAMPLLTGAQVRKPLWQSRNVIDILQIDPDFEEVLAFIRSLPADARVLTLPLSDPGYQIVAALHGGAYMGPSTTAYLAGKKDFAGFTEFSRYKDLIINLIKNKRYEQLKQIFGILNIKYIFYNADPTVYDKFPSFPYIEARKFLPKNQKLYMQMVQNIGYTQIKNISNKYFVFELQNSQFLPQIFIAKKLLGFNKDFTDIPVPMSLNPNENRIALVSDYNRDTVDLHVTFDQELIDIQNYSSFTNYFPGENKSVFGFPFSSWDTNSLFYPLVLARERKELNGFKVTDDEYIDRSVFLAEKRISELERWGENVPIMGNVKSIDSLSSSWREPNYIGTLIFKKYYFWEINILRYQRAVSQIIDRLEKPNKSNFSMVSNKLKLNRAVSFDRNILYYIIQKNEKLTKEDKVYLLKLSIKVFDSILKRLQVKIPPPEDISYNLGTLQKGTYDIFVEKTITKNFDQVKWQMDFNNEKLPLADFQQDQNWFKGKRITVDDKSSNILKLRVPESINIGAEANWKSIERKVLEKSYASLMQDNTKLGDTSGLVKEIPNWNPRANYILSFDYRTFGKKFRVTVHDLREILGLTRVFEDEIGSNEWEKFTTIVPSSEDSNSAFLQITKVAGDEFLEKSLAQLSGRKLDNTIKVEIRNFSIVQIPNPKIILRKVGDESNQNVNIPKISFTRINPTKYEVDIKGATSPYALVFAEAFNKRWKLTRKPQEDNMPVRPSVKVLTYFNGDISENVGKDVFFNAKTFETWSRQEIAPDKHFAVNGYSNAWYIEPKDMGNKPEYMLTLELETQQNFYKSFALSLSVVILCILFLIMRLYKRVFA